MARTKKLNVGDFTGWQEYYWTYQYNLARDFYVPMFEEWGLRGEGLKVVDVGCGDGGFTAALADWGASCTGIEIKPFARKAYDNPRLRYMVQDITAPDAPGIIGDDHGLVILRDVIEHIPVPSKGAFLQSALRLMKPDGRMLITFPPYFSPFGLHQQTILKSRLRKVPFLSLMPRAALDFIMEKAGETASSMAEIDSIRESRMTIRGFKRLVKEQGLGILEERHYLVRPSHEIRYGWRTTEARWGRVPLLREMFILGTAYLLARET
jgi:SAM-dependent methyltransferase